MKNLFIALLVVIGLAPLAQADINDSMNHSEIMDVRPRPRPEPYPGNPGRPDPYPGNPRPEPRPDPRPYPPPHYRSEFITCGSYNYRYNECYINPYYLYQIRVYQVHSYEPCYWGQTTGAYNDRIWVDRGCRATFEIIRYY
ncbi:DUF3011 domain-containing protein [Bdellovibrio sp. 22V]|uniref:DUF3011 domain-containing protein n=1 Tax=Bdellovibrio TaxID=958 RepID=UPI0025434772|nr:DUF3011 domain-containing protein [Bdellovibrio sp. 22V]WII73497.1 DUF3011 domain-containing protein [Bdellovibrio sp. 22V]